MVSFISWRIMMNVRVVATLLICSVMIIVMIAGQLNWNKKIQWYAVHATSDVIESDFENKLVLVQDVNTKNSQQITDEQYREAIINYEEKLSAILYTYQEEIYDLIAQAETDYFTYVLADEQTFQEFITIFSEKASEIREEKEREFLATCSEFAMVLGILPEELQIYYLVFEETAMNLQILFVSEIIYLQI